MPSSKYQSDFPDKLYRLSLLGATQAQMAEVLGVAIPTLEIWIKNKPEVRKAVKTGALPADANVARSLYQRAIGYDYTEEAIVNGDIVQLRKHMPAHPLAILAWLRNRQKGLWAGADSGVQNMNVTIAPSLTREEWMGMINGSTKRLEVLDAVDSRSEDS